MSGRGVVAGLALACLVAHVSLAAPPPARAAHTLDDATVQALGGTYAVDCRKPGGVHLLVAADTLAIQAGTKRVESHDVQKALTFAGHAPPADYLGTLLGDVHGGEPIVFQTYRDAHGPYLVVDADASLQTAFGQASLTGRFRSCEAAPKGAPPAGKRPPPPRPAPPR
jgi:hypothetical protein